MSKFIFDYQTIDVKAPYKNKYTVVYENKTNYYCKVTGSDELKSFSKHYLKSQYATAFLIESKSNSELLLDSEIKEAMQRYELNTLRIKNNHDIEHRDYLLQSVSELNEKIEATEMKINALEKKDL